jgi:hypothetical protein
MADIDIHNIKNLDNLFRSISSSFITFTPALVQDTSANYVTPIVDGKALLVSGFTPDSTSPFVTFISFDMNNSIITLNFNELVLPSSVHGDGLTVQALSGPSLDSRYTLSPYSTALTADKFSTTVKLSVYTPDMNAIKSLYPLASSLNSTYISLAGKFVTDTYQNPVANIYPWAAREVDEWFPNLKPPTLVTYDLNMDQNYIDLVFEEAVDGSSLNLSQAVIQTLPIRAYGKHITFIGAKFYLGLGYDANQLHIQLQGNIIDYMKLNQIGYDISTSLLTWSNTFLGDFSGNRLSPVWDGSILGGDPITPNVFTPDITSPTVVFWFADMANFQIHIRFDEPVIITNITAFTMWQGKPSLGLFSYSFNTVSAITASPTDPKEFIISLHDYCLNSTRPLSLCGDDTLSHLISTTIYPLYLSCSQLGAKDLAQNPNLLTAILLANPLVAGAPDCSLCDPGFYISTNCTSHSDRVCSPCTKCGYGLWAKEQCSAYRDTGCTGKTREYYNVTLTNIRNLLF